MKKYLLLSIIFCLFLIIITLNAKAQSYADPASGDTANFPYYFQMMQDPDANFQGTVNAFEKYWAGRANHSHNGWKMFKRWEYIHKDEVQPDGKLPSPGYVLTEYQKYMMRRVPASPEGYWTEIGPVTLPANPGNPFSQPNGMGRINGIGFHPTNPLIFYVGAPSGGLWKTMDGGSTWSALISDLPTLGVSAILMDPADPDWILIGTGDRDAADAPGLGVYKSIDGGITFLPSNTGMDNKTVAMLLMHPSDPEIIFAATSGGIYKSTDHGVNWVLKTNNTTFKDIKFKPGDPTIMYAAQWGKFFRSADSGETWTQITAGVVTGQRLVIGVSPNQPGYVYLCQASNVFKGLLKSTDSGLTFTTQSTSPNIIDYECDGSGAAGQATYDLCIAVDPNNANTIFVGSLNIWKSINGGVTWTINTHWKGATYGYPCAQSMHSDMHVMEWSPANGELYLGSDAGVFHTADLGTSWNNISSGLAIAQVYKIGQSATSQALSMNGFQDNGTAKSTGTAFTTVLGGDGMECIVDYSDTNYRYCEIYNGWIFRSIGGDYNYIAGNGIHGITESGGWVTPYIQHETVPTTMFAGYQNVWRSINVKATTEPVAWTKISTGEIALCDVLEQSPANTDILYVVRGIYLKRSDNANDPNPAWTICTNPGGSINITDLEAHPTDSNTVYATVGKKVYKSVDKGNTWTDISGTLPEININTLVFDKNSNEGIYIGNKTGVFYKDATMSDWIVYSTNLPTVDVRELEIFYDSANPINNRLKVATYGRGLWESELYSVTTLAPANQNVASAAGETTFTVTSNSTWTASSDSPWCNVTSSGSGNGSIIADYLENTTYNPRVATITVIAPGQTPLPVTVTQDQLWVSVPENSAHTIHIYPNPTSGAVMISAAGVNRDNLEVSVTDVTGKLFQYSRFKGADEYPIDLSSFPQGCYFIKIRTANEVVIRKLILER
jgi:photosystem II stability/assembly factor-like uncharacterized protein